jgi:tRNA(Ile)-lysidine synthase
VPFLKEINPNLLESFNNTVNNLKGSQQIVEDYIKLVKEKTMISKGNTIHIAIDELKKLNNVKVYLYQLLNEYGFTEWDDITNLINAQSGKQVYSKTHRLLKDRDVLILSPFENNDTFEDHIVYEIEEHTSKIKVPFKLKFKKIEIPFDTKNHTNKVYEDLFLDEKNTISIDFDKLTFPLTIRKKQKGDFFFPIGMLGKKKVSKFFKDEKLSLIAKENTWLLCSKNEIVWIIGMRLDERFKVSKNTSTILKIKL